MEKENPVTAFTVKHELSTWLERNSGGYRVFRIPDGTYSNLKLAEITDEFIEAVVVCTLTLTPNGSTVPKEPWDSGLPLYDLDCSEHGNLTKRNTFFSVEKIAHDHNR
jgi:hypothetical protein